MIFKSNHKRKKYFWITSTFVVLISVLMFVSNQVITSSTKGFIKTNTNDLPNCKTALLLGTSKLLKNGHSNQYFYNRIIATVDLFKSGKIKFIIISGDNSQSNYNEPLDMKNALIKNGIPDSLIYLDYAGFRTFDSVIRAKEIFGQSSFIIISQEFHNQRAIYIARHYGIEAYGFNAKDVNAYMGFKTKLRELFARVKVFIDFIIGEKPKFMGERIQVRS